MRTEITKRTQLSYVNNDMVSGYYYYIQGRIYTDNEQSYYKFGFVIWCEIMEMCEYFEKDTINKKERLEYITETANCFIDNHFIKSEKDIYNFIKSCNETIENYNKRF